MCSVSTGSAWLDRLRASKGFPAISDPALDLDGFLSADPNSDLSPPPSPPPPPPTKKKLTPALDLVSTALADLFVMGSPTSVPHKSLRKQLRPRPCATLLAVCRESPSADNSVAEEAKLARGKAKVKARVKPARRKRQSRGPASADLAACSRTEVTVIDTSAPGWKSEKLIFRRGTAWKVRDKKVWCAWRKKRRLGLVEKMATDKGKEAPPPSLPLNEECTPNDKEDASEETNDHAQFPRRRIKFSRSPRVPAAKDSSLYRLQVVTTSSNNPASCSRTKLKGQ